MKLLNNFSCGVQVASLAEGIPWLERSGLDRDLALDIPKRDYTVNFMLDLIARDLLYAQQAAALEGVELTNAANARALFYTRSIAWRRA